MNIKERIEKSISAALQEIDPRAKDFSLSIERTDNPAHGEYSFAAMKVFQYRLDTTRRHKNAVIGTPEEAPIIAAKELVGSLREMQIEGVEKAEVAGPGFINFFLSREYFSETVGDILKIGKRYGTGSLLKERKVMVEYTDPNPFKEFHIGHLMSNTIGESVARLFEAQGATVKRACYQGDVGLHVAKAIWGMQSVPHREGSPLEKLALIGKVRYLGQSYALGAAAYQDGHKEEIEALNKKIYERSDSEINKLYDWGRKVSLEHFEAIYKRLGTEFDFHFFESNSAGAGKEIVEQALKKGIFEKSDNAVVFRAELHDPKLHTRVFVNSQGIPTYEAKELGLALMKQKQWKHDGSVVITGNEVNDYFRVLLQAMKLLYPELAEKTEHLSHGMLRLPSGKMSSRTGDVITGESLLTDVSKLVAEKIQERGYDERLQKEIIEAVSVGAIKYSILRQAIGGDIIFDFEKSISFEGDSGPYLQYSATRANSVLEKARKEGLKPDVKKPTDSAPPFERLLAYFPETVERAAKERAPHLIVTYLTKLAGEFNSYYAHETIADKSDVYSPYKIALTKAFRQVMENGLWILGIQVPSRM